ncbi:MAG: hypothetical protein ACTSXH_09740 [Promethearchaeota archaeon]
MLRLKFRLNVFIKVFGEQNTNRCDIINPKIEDASALKRAKQCLKTIADDISFFE